MPQISCFMHPQSLQLHQTIDNIAAVQSSRSVLVPQLMWLLAAAARDCPAAQAAALAEGLPLLLGRILVASNTASSSSSSNSSQLGRSADLDASGGGQGVPSDSAALQVACCGALESLLEGCTAAQVRLVSLCCL